MAVETTPEGYLVVGATLFRDGIYEYGAGELKRWGVPLDDRVPDNAVVRVYRDPADIFDPRSMKTFEMVPLTQGHPKDSVSPDSIQRLFRGIVESPVVRDGCHARAKVRIMHKDAIAAYKKGMRQLSMGYSSVIDMTPGTTVLGEPYDMKQTQNVGNHAAMVPQGRAGSAALGDIKMADKTDVIDAVEHGKVKQQLADAQAEVGKLKKENDRLKGEVDGLKSSAVSDEALKKLVDAGVEEALALMKSRESTLARTKLMAPKFEAKDADTLRSIMVAGIQAQRPDIKIDDSVSDDRVAGIFDGIQVRELPSTNRGPVRNTKPNVAAIRTAAHDQAPDFGRLKQLVR